ncbi:hypothetical protein Tco_0037463 [Tanacetum coccineum]
MNEEQIAQIARDEDIARQWDEEERKRAMDAAESTKKIDWNDPSVIRYHSLKMKPKLCDFCGIHILLMDNGLAIHMLTEKKYPLSQEIFSKMLSRKLEVDHESSQAFELLRFIRAQVQK